MTRILQALTALAYVACIVSANVLTDRFGLVSIGFGLLVTAGTFAAGATLLARNIGQDKLGRLPILALMVVGAGLSWWLASPALAVASATAFGVSELADMLVYSTLRRRGFSRAVIAASIVGGLADTLLFLKIAGFPVTRDAVTGQLAVKVGISAAVALVVIAARVARRQGVTRGVVYLAGPINGCTDAEANDWRTYVKAHVENTLDPMRRDYRGREDESVDEIVELDKVDIDACDVFLANCPRPSYGTAMEILYAWQAGKPVITIVPVDAAVSPWVRYHSTAVVHTLDDAIEACLA